jgi:itaconyl-CoA hydratase
MAIKEGWRGRFFEDFEVGDVYEHPLGRTVTTTDNLWFTLLTQNTAPIHVDHAYAAKTEFGRPLVDSTFTVALVTGQSVTDVSQNVFAKLGWDEIRLPAPSSKATRSTPGARSSKNAALARGPAWAS